VAADVQLNGPLPIESKVSPAGCSNKDQSEALKIRFFYADS